MAAHTHTILRELLREPWGVICLNGSPGSLKSSLSFVCVIVKSRGGNQRLKWSISDLFFFFFCIFLYGTNLVPHSHGKLGQ